MTKTQTLVNRTTTHDRISVAAKFPSGASFRWSITRSGESLTVAFANDRATANAQHKVIGDYLSQLKGTNGERMDLTAELLRSCKSGAEVIGKMLDAVKFNNNQNKN